jgi:beta-glucosidase
MHARGATPDGALSIAPIDRNAQEDARLLQWTGRRALLELLATPALEFGAPGEEGLALIVDLRIDRLPATGRVEWLLDCGPGCAASVDATAQLGALPRGRWLRVGMPLDCLRAGGDAGRRRVATPFALRAEAGLTLALSQIAIGRDPEHRLTCPSSAASR